MLNRAFAVGAGTLALVAGTTFGQAITENFDDITIPLANDWFTFNNSEDPTPGFDGWFQGIDDPRISSHSGDGTSYAAVNYQGTQGGNGTETLSEWLLMPTRLLHNGDVLRFYTRTITPATAIYPDRMQVRLSTAGTSTNVGTMPFDLGDFTTLLLDINPQYSMELHPGPPSGSPPVVNGFPVDWTQYTLTLSGLSSAGVSGRFAFRYFVENGGIAGVNSNFMGVDDVEYIPAGTGGGCYANCDGSTNTPILNVNDFICFQQQFAAGASYANCDGSTQVPVLNVNDFICFQQRFAGGCTAP